MFKVNINDVQVYTNFLVYTESDYLVAANILERSKYAVHSAIASVYKNYNITGRSIPNVKCGGKYVGYYKGVQKGKVLYHHGFVKSDRIFSNTTSVMDDGTINTFLCASEHKSLEQSLFEALYELHDLPLKEEWAEYLLRIILEKEYIKPCKIIRSEEFSYPMKIGEVCTDMNNWMFYHLKVKLEDIDQIVSEGIQKGYIQVASKPQENFETIESVDEYFQIYGNYVIDNVLGSITPSVPRISTMNYKSLKKTPFPVQAEVINGVHHHLKANDYIIINGGMGVGKTYVASMAVGMLKENSRTLVMGPSHIMKKWGEEISGEIPNAKVKFIRSFKDVVSLRELQKTPPKGKEFYLFSKDFLKLSYEQVPAIVGKYKRRNIPIVKCEECNAISYDTLKTTCACGSKELKRTRSFYSVKGMICPSCSEIVFPLNPKISSELNRTEEDSNALTLEDFEGRSNKNSICSHCGDKLWRPGVTNLNCGGEYHKMQCSSKGRWLKVKIARNKSNRTFKTIFKEKNDLLVNGHTDDYSLVKMNNSRKYSPALFIKKYLKDFFDFGIFDECHQLKSGDSAQGNAFGQLLKACKKSMLLTGTIAGGVASDLFYLLFRVDPNLMLRNGYTYDDVMKFASEYGVVEETREFENSTVYFNKSSNGRSVGSKKILPGISPLVFTTFLINNTVFLDLSDFEAFLPETKEYPIQVELNSKQLELYERVQNTFKSWLREPGANKLLGQFLPTLLSLPDVNVLAPIIHPENGSEIFRFDKDLEYFLEEDGLLPKERKLLEIIEKELSEGRNAFVYCEFTSEGDKNITQRLKRIIETKLDLENQVAILKAGSPSATDRMDWIKERASEGVRVFICNPRLVETGRALASS